MPDFIHEIAPDRLATLFAIVFVGAAIAGILILKPILRLFFGRADTSFNESVGYGTASFSLFYALLAGLLTVAAYQNRERIEQSVLAEARAVGALYAAMDLYPEPLRSDVKEMLRDYVLFTTLRDWPAHRVGSYMDGGAHRVDALRLRLAGFAPPTTALEIMHRETLAALSDFTRERQNRLNGTITRIPPVLWYAVLVGAVLNLLIIILLRIPLLSHLLLATISAFFLGVVLYVITILDDPLRGMSAIQPVAFELLWNRQMRWDEALN